MRSDSHLPSDWQTKRRGFLKGAAASLAFTLVAGCGSEGGDFALVNPSAAGVTVPTDLPTLSPRVTSEPEEIPGKDAGQRNTVRVIASQGGQFTLSDGTKIIIPAGALAQDTEISAVVPTTRQNPDYFQYRFEPSGIVFSSPIFVVVPHNLPHPEVLFGASSSRLDPVVGTGTEPNNWKPTQVVGVDANSVTLALNHFTFVWALLPGSAPCYVVCDIPYRYLKSGDALFYLTNGISGASWYVGHVGMLTKNAGPFAGASENTMVHSDGISVKEADAAEIALAEGHIYLGARRKLNLTDTQFAQMAVFLKQQLGKPWDLIGETGLATDVFFDSWSCVGLVDYAYSVAQPGGILHFARKASGSTPLELLSLMPPVEEIEIFAGEPFEMPVYVAAIRDDAATLTILGTYSRFTSGEAAATYTFESADLPAGSVLEPAALKADKDGNRTPGYLFKWTPSESLVGQTFRISFRAQTNRFDASLQSEGTRRLRLKVVKGRGRYEVVRTFSTPIDPDSTGTFFWDPRINAAGDLAFAQQDYKALPNFERVSGPLTYLFFPHDGVSTVVDSANDEILFAPRSGHDFSPVELTEKPEMIYYLGHNTGVPLRIKRPGTPSVSTGATLNAESFLLYTTGPRDIEDKVVMFGDTYEPGSVTRSELSVHTLGTEVATIDLRAKSGQNYAIVSQIAANDSGLALISANDSTGSDAQDDALILYQFPRTDLAESTTVLIGLGEGIRIGLVAINNAGEYAYYFSGGGQKAIRIHKSDGSERVIDQTNVAHNDLIRLRLTDAGDLLLFEDVQGEAGKRVVLFPANEGPPVYLGDFYPADFNETSGDHRCSDFWVDKTGGRVVLVNVDETKMIVLEDSAVTNPGPPQA